jgi:hypothetical protein
MSDMYRQFLSRADYDEIVADYGRYGADTMPHCNVTMFHEPGICAFCDGYYRLNPNFKPTAYVTREANGWGGNQAPIVDDAKAMEEQSAWDRLWARLGL